MTGSFLFTRTNRARRAAEWTAGKAVTFIVTLAATRNVTLAARAAGMSRKSAYALQHRDPAFAAAWASALAAVEGDKVEELEEPRIRRRRGDGQRAALRRRDERRRDLCFARLARACPESAPGLN
jgi:hypothetical protein